MTNKVFLVGAFMLLGGCKEHDPPAPNSNTLPKIVINEFMASNKNSFPDPSDPGEYDDWIEIHNVGSTSVDMGGMYVSDNKKNKTKYRIPTTDAAVTTIPAGGYLLLWTDDQVEQGVLHLPFKLSAEEEDIGIYTSDGVTIEETTFTSQETDVSTGRLPDGTGPWTTFSASTPGAANQ